MCMLEVKMSKIKHNKFKMLKNSLKFHLIDIIFLKGKVYSRKQSSWMHVTCVTIYIFLC